MKQWQGDPMRHQGRCFLYCFVSEIGLNSQSEEDYQRFRAKWFFSNFNMNQFIQGGEQFISIDFVILIYYG